METWNIVTPVSTPGSLYTVYGNRNIVTPASTPGSLYTVYGDCNIVTPFATKEPTARKKQRTELKTSSPAYKNGRRRRGSRSDLRRMT